MTLKETKELKLLADEAGKKPQKVADIIVSELLSKKIISRTNENWGYRVEECFEHEVSVKQLSDIIASTSIYPVRSGHIDALINCVVMGDFDCPECGGEMEITDGEYRCTGGDGYITPYEYEPIWEEKTCTHCGKIISNEQ